MSQYENVILEAVEKPTKSYKARVNEEIRKIREALVTGEIENLKALSNCTGNTEINILNRLCAKHNSDFDNYKPKTQSYIRTAIWSYFHPEAQQQQEVTAEESAAMPADADFKTKLKAYMDQNGGILFSHQLDNLDL
jgi:hypothetical protein